MSQGQVKGQSALDRVSEAGWMEEDDRGQGRPSWVLS